MIAARRLDAFDEQTKWKNMFCGHDECWRIDKIAAMDPRMYVVSSVIATWTWTVDFEVSVMEGHFGEL
jgi:hypothetical protein